MHCRRALLLFGTCGASKYDAGASGCATTVPRCVGVVGDELMEAPDEVPFWAAERWDRGVREIARYPDRARRARPHARARARTDDNRAPGVGDGPPALSRKVQRRLDDDVDRGLNCGPGGTLTQGARRYRDASRRGSCRRGRRGPISAERVSRERCPVWIGRRHWCRRRAGPRRPRARVDAPSDRLGGLGTSNAAVAVEPDRALGRNTLLHAVGCSSPGEGQMTSRADGFSWSAPGHGTFEIPSSPSGADGCVESRVPASGRPTHGLSCWRRDLRSLGRVVMSEREV